MAFLTDENFTECRYQSLAAIANCEKLSFMDSGLDRSQTLKGLLLARLVMWSALRCVALCREQMPWRIQKIRQSQPEMANSHAHTIHKVFNLLSAIDSQNHLEMRLPVRNIFI